jgi:hypothetical protein
VSEDFEDYTRIFVPKDLSLDKGWELKALLRTVEEAMQAAQTGKESETYQLVVEAPAALSSDELAKLFEVVATAAHDFEERFPERTWDVFVAGGVLNEEHSAEAAFRRVFDEREKLRAEVEGLRSLIHKLYFNVAWSETDLTFAEKELFTSAFRWAEGRDV